MTVVRFWRIVWAVALRLRLWPLLDLRCDGRLPCLSFVPTNTDGTEGYYRGGIQAQYCQLPRGHRHPLCLAPINYHGHRVHGGVRFQPELEEQEAA